mmetsp:Transcript_39851/g.79888  ORF Transcript_39851/g.79888 Transcript_39851/m.79888 type:complete len:255 (-) Transcript_39851:156-920(-)
MGVLHLLNNGATAVRAPMLRTVRGLVSAAASKKVAVVFSGCGVFDGTEVTEGTAALVHLSRAGAQVQVFAPDKEQMHALDHTKGAELPEKRNVLVESARIARGNVQPLQALKASDYDALIFPGGFGAAKNLSSWAVDGTDCKVDEDVARTIKEFHSAQKPIGACCIAPVLLAKVLQGKDIMVTVGSQGGEQWPYGGTIGQIESLGAKHETTTIDGVCVDSANKLATSPAFMYEGGFAEVHDSVGKMVDATLGMA